MLFDKREMKIISSKIDNKITITFELLFRSIFALIPITKITICDNVYEYEILVRMDKAIQKIESEKQLNLKMVSTTFVSMISFDAIKIEYVIIRVKYQ